MNTNHFLCFLSIDYALEFEDIHLPWRLKKKLAAFQKGKASVPFLFFSWKDGGGGVALTTALGYLQQNQLGLAALPAEVEARMGARRWGVRAVPSSPAEVPLWPPWGRAEKLRGE